MKSEFDNLILGFADIGSFFHTLFDAGIAGDFAFDLRIYEIPIFNYFVFASDQKITAISFAGIVNGAFLAMPMGSGRMLNKADASPESPRLVRSA